MNLRHLLILTPLLLASTAHGNEVPPVAQSKTLTVLQLFPVYKGDTEEPASERLARLTEIADAIDEASRNAEEQALLITVAWHESAFARYVQHDEPRCSEGHGGRCDGGASWSNWQIKGTDRTGGVVAAAALAISKLRGALGICKRRGKAANPVAAAISLYASGRTCSWGGVTDRVATFKRVRAAL